MIRRLLNLLTFGSLLLCVAVVALWVRSYAVSQFLGWSDPSQFVGALSMRGLVRLEHGTWPNEDQGWSYVANPTPGRAGLWQEVRARDRRGGALRTIGVAYARVDYTPGSQVRRALYLPHWLLAGATLAVPMGRLFRTIRARRRPAAGLCRACGYDLTGNVSGVCPECGTAR